MNIGPILDREEFVEQAYFFRGFRERLALTIIAGRKPPEASSEQPRMANSCEELDTQLLTDSANWRPGSRFVPPPPSLSLDKMEQILARQGPGATRARKNASKLRQSQLPLEIISKGRFDKSEPTIHKGEDLDVPTYIRRGVALN